MVENAIAFDERSKKELTAAMQDITNLDNPNSVQQMKEWLFDNGVETESLDKKVVKELIKTTNEQSVQDALILRQQPAKSSVKEISGNAERCLQGRTRPRHVPVLRCKPLRQMGRPPDTTAEPSAESSP